MSIFEEQYKELSQKLISAEKQLQVAEVQRAKLEKRLELLAGVSQSFNVRDVTQQIIGVLLIVIPLTLTISIRDFIVNLSWLRILISFIAFLILALLLVYFNKYHNVREPKLLGLPLRWLCLLLVTISVTLIIFLVFDIYNFIGCSWSLFFKFYLFTFGFSLFGAATADLIK